MTAVILHFSDTHRTPGTQASNSLVWNGLRTDIEIQWPEDNRTLLRGRPQLESPNIIVMSGDLVQGDDSGDCELIREQYREAADLFGTMAQKLLSGDRAKLVVVPGNHDVCWNHSRQSFRSISGWDEATAKLARDPVSSIRIEEEHGNRSLVEIAGEDLYEQRFLHFKEFFDSFYSGTDVPVYALDPQSQFTLYPFPDSGIVIAGFNSCDRNDHLNTQGRINRDAIAGAAKLLDDSSAMRDLVRIAVWHHNTDAAPARDDYIDKQCLEWLIGNKFVLGLHGHMHKTEFEAIQLVRRVRLSRVSAGSLCVGAKERPESTPRQFNLVSLDLPNARATVHVREKDTDDSPWQASQRFGLARASYFHVPLESIDKHRTTFPNSTPDLIGAWSDQLGPPQVIVDWPADARHSDPLDVVEGTGHVDGELLFLGMKGTQTIIETTPDRMRSVYFDLLVEIQDDFGDPTRWFGVLCCQGTPRLDAGLLAYLRANGSLEVTTKQSRLTRLPPSGNLGKDSLVNRRVGLRGLLTPSSLLLAASTTLGPNPDSDASLEPISVGPTPAPFRLYLVAFQCSLRVDRLALRGWD